MQLPHRKRQLSPNSPMGKEEICNFHSMVGPPMARWTWSIAGGSGPTRIDTMFSKRMIRMYLLTLQSTPALCESGDASFVTVACMWQTRRSMGYRNCFPTYLCIVIFCTDVSPCNKRYPLSIASSNWTGRMAAYLSERDGN